MHKESATDTYVHTCLADLGGFMFGWGWTAEGKLGSLFECGLLDSPWGCDLLDSLCGCDLLDSLCGCGLLDSLCGCSLRDSSCGCGLLDSLCGCALLGLLSSVPSSSSSSSSGGLTEKQVQNLKFSCQMYVYEHQILYTLPCLYYTYVRMSMCASIPTCMFVYILCITYMGTYTCTYVCYRSMHMYMWKLSHMYIYVYTDTQSQHQVWTCKLQHVGKYTYMNNYTWEYCTE